MTVSLKKFLFVIVLALALLAGLLGGSMQTTASPLLPSNHHTSTVQTHSVAKTRPFPVCPPPPVDCW